MTMFSPKINDSLTDNFGSRCRKVTIPSPSPSPNFILQSESESESDEMAGSEKLCYFGNVLCFSMQLSTSFHYSTAKQFHY
jgi:hypothetical protein